MPTSVAEGWAALAEFHSKVAPSRQTGYHHERSNNRSILECKLIAIGVYCHGTGGHGSSDLAEWFDDLVVVWLRPNHNRFPAIIIPATGFWLFFGAGGGVLRKRKEKRGKREEKEH